MTNREKRVAAFTKVTLKNNFLEQAHETLSHRISDH